jgi:hypothetical protein
MAGCGKDCWLYDGFGGPQAGDIPFFLPTKERVFIDLSDVVDPSRQVTDRWRYQTYTFKLPDQARLNAAVKLLMTLLYGRDLVYVQKPPENKRLEMKDLKDSILIGESQVFLFKANYEVEFVENDRDFDVQKIVHLAGDTTLRQVTDMLNVEYARAGVDKVVHELYTYVDDVRRTWTDTMTVKDVVNLRPGIVPFVYVQSVDTHDVAALGSRSRRTRKSRRSRRSRRGARKSRRSRRSRRGARKSRYVSRRR